MSVLLVGTGVMGTGYARVLHEMGVPFSAVGRGEATIASFTAETGYSAYGGGIEAWLTKHPDPPATAIVATDVVSLAGNAVALLEHGVREMLLEKPGGATPADIDRVASVAKDTGARVVVGYNRRFYASTTAAAASIATDGGASSVTFEFTELGDRVAASDHPEVVKHNWLLANSTHVIDLAFFLTATPVRMTCYAAGSLAWHPDAVAFGGAGETASGALFSYHANWDAPGRWGVEVLTPRNRLIFRPLEQLHVQRRNAMEVVRVPIDDHLDRRFKPGLYRQVEGFLHGDERLLDIADHAHMVESIYQPMLHGTPR